jgi:hypothetical protein
VSTLLAFASRRPGESDDEPSPHSLVRVELSRNELLHAILSRAASDTMFRERLLAEPKGAIRDAFGLRIAEDYRIRFIEKPRGLDALIVLPARREPQELTDVDAELRNVVGGAGEPVALFDHVEWSPSLLP